MTTQTQPPHSTTLATTPLYDTHLALGAKMVPFAGYLMPLQYPGGSTAEHIAVRTRAGLFDVSHMGELVIRGREALQFVDTVTSTAATTMAVGQVRYASILAGTGIIVDDCLVYRLGDAAAMLVVNASNRAAALEHLYHYADRFDCTIDDDSDQTALLALQGPRAAAVLARCTRTPLDTIRYYHFIESSVDGIPALISRTGYTGEDGFELYIASGDAVALWITLMSAGDAGDVMPAGLGARDSLRLEMAMPLYGHELDATTTPLDAGLAWTVDFTKPSFIGRDALLAQRDAGIRRRLVGFRVDARAIPRPNYSIYADDTLVGQVCSGTMSPTLGVPIGTCYLPTALAAPGTSIQVDVRGTRVPATVVKTPFVPRHTLK
jgi:aminomethyltransferase